MQFAAYITRADDWPFEARERFPIAEAEWAAYLAGDPEFRPAGPGWGFWRDAAGGPPVRVPLAAEPGHWTWAAHPRYPEVQPDFQYLRAGVIVRAPDAPTHQGAGGSRGPRGKGDRGRRASVLAAAEAGAAADRAGGG